jgi:hypothetical protein
MVHADLDGKRPFGTASVSTIITTTKMCAIWPNLMEIT